MLSLKLKPIGLFKKSPKAVESIDIAGMVSICVVTNRPKWVPFVSHQINKLILETRRVLPMVSYEVIIVGSGKESEYTSQINIDRFDKIENGGTEAKEKLEEMSIGLYSNAITKFYSIDGSIGTKRNYAMKKATGDYVCFVDDDDIQQVGRIVMSLMIFNQLKGCTALGQIFCLCGDVKTDKLFYCSDSTDNRGVQEGSLFMRRNVFVFNDSNGNEIPASASIYKVDARNFCLNVILNHGNNTCKREPAIRNGIFSTSVHLTAFEKKFISEI